MNGSVGAPQHSQFITKHHSSFSRDYYAPVKRQRLLYYRLYACTTSLRSAPPISVQQVVSSRCNMRSALWRSPRLQLGGFLHPAHGKRALSEAVKRPRKLLFPGQGSQYVGMTGKLPPSQAVDSLYATAASALGYDLRALCLEGPQERLNETIHCQPAVVVASLAALEQLGSRDRTGVSIPQRV